LKSRENFGNLLTVNPQEINKFLRATPFIPFRVHTGDGKHLDINHPEFAIVTRIMLIVGRAVSDPKQDIPDEADWISPLHIVRLEPLVAA
jgi:hypothetical protein